jgi:hypothetical protein
MRGGGGGRDGEGGGVREGGKGRGRGEGGVLPCVQPAKTVSGPCHVCHARYDALHDSHVLCAQRVGAFVDIILVLM